MRGVMPEMHLCVTSASFRDYTGTHLVTDIALGNEDVEIFKLHPVADGRVLFQRKNATSDTDVWITDGSEVGSRRLASLKRWPDVVAVLNGIMLLVSENDQFGRELHAVDIPELTRPAAESK